MKWVSHVSGHVFPEELQLVRQVPAADHPSLAGAGPVHLITEMTGVGVADVRPLATDVRHYDHTKTLHIRFIEN